MEGIRGAVALAGVLCLVAAECSAAGPPAPSASSAGAVQGAECGSAPPFVSDSFSGQSGLALGAHTGERGATWSDWPAASGRAQLTRQMRVRASTAGPHAVLTASGAPPGPDYEVSADFHVVSLGETTLIGLLARRDDADSEYMGWYNSASGTWGIARRLGGTGITIGSTYSQTLNVGGTYRAALRVRGSRISLLVDGLERVSGIDTSVGAPGRAGIRIAQAGRAADDAGIQLGNFRAAGCSS